MGGVGRHAVIYGLGIVLQRALSFVMLPVYTRYLTPADYGVLALIEMTLDVIAIFAGAQLALGVFRFYHKAETRHEKGVVVSTALIGLGASYGLVAFAAFTGAPLASELLFDSTEQVGLIRLAAGAMFFSGMTVIPLAYARVEDRSTLFVMANLVRMVLGLGLNIYTLVYLGMGVRGVFLSSLISSATVGLWLSASTLRRVGIHFSSEATRSLLRYGLPLIATQIATFTATFGDRYFINVHAGQDDVGIYNMAYQFAFLLALVGYVPFETVWAPRRFAIARRPDREAALNRGFEIENILLLTCALGIALLVDDVLRVMTTPPFHPAGEVVPILLVAYVFQAWAGVQDIGILIEEKTEYLTLANWVAAAVALVGYAVLIPRYVGLGAAIATVLSFGTRWGLTFWFSQRLWPVRYRWGPTLRLATLVVVFTVANELVRAPESLVLSIAMHLAGVAAYLVLAWAWALSEDSKGLIRNALGVALARTSWGHRFGNSDG